MIHDDTYYSTNDLTANSVLLYETFKFYLCINNYSLMYVSIFNVGWIIRLVKRVRDIQTIILSVPPNLGI